MKSIEIFLRKLLLNILLLFNPPRKDTQLPQFISSSKILFIRLNRIGDALVTTPLLSIIKEKLGCKIIVLADKNNHFIFEQNPSVDEVVLFNKGIKSFFEIKKFIKDSGVDCVVDLHDDVSTTVSFLVALANAKFKFALRKDNFNLYTHTVQRIDSTKYHVVDRILKLSELFNLKYNPSEIKIEFSVNDSTNKIASDRIKLLNQEGKFLVGINISAGSPARFWGIDKYQKLISLLEKYNLRTILFCSSNEINLAEQITGKENIYPPSKDFINFAAGILQVDLLITPDTSAVHIAASKKIPVFGLYVKYNTKDMIWSPYNTEFDAVITEEPTLENMTFYEVKHKLIPFLEKQIDVKRNS